MTDAQSIAMHDDWITRAPEGDCACPVCPLDCECSCHGAPDGMDEDGGDE
jgi:hypothetical protein